jgi:uncharacterized membrane protein
MARSKPAPAKRGSSRSDNDKLFALLGTGLPLVGYIVAVLAKKNSPYVQFYAKQGLVLFVTWIIALLVEWIFSFIPIIGGFLSMVIWVLYVIVWVVGIVNALSGEVKDLPVIGVYAGKF